MHWATFRTDRLGENPGPTIVARLAGAGANPNAVDYSGRSPLHVGVHVEAEPQILEVLIAVGADPDLADDDGMTPIDLASGLDDDSPVLAVLLKATKGDRIVP